MTKYTWSQAEKSRTLNSRISLAMPNQLIHDHCAIIRKSHHIPENDIDALIWLHCRQEALVDLVWHIANSVAPLQPIRVLDLGCGVGGTLSRLLSLDEYSDKLELVGVTESEEQVATAERILPDVTWLVGDMLTFPALPLNWFHLIIAIESTEQLDDLGLASFMARAAKLLMQDGILIVVAHTRISNTPPDTKDELNQHFNVKLASLDAYEEAASNADLAILGTIDLTSIATSYWKIRYSRAIFCENGGLEETMYTMLEGNQAAYKLLVWWLKPPVV